MVRQLTHMLIALIVALATVLPINVHAMPMSPGMSGMGIQQNCPNCPHRAPTGTNSEKMPACQVLACAGPIAALPSTVLLPGRVLLRATYLTVTSIRWTTAPRAPDPFPPRPIALV